MTNEFTTIRESSQLIEVTEFDNELFLELTSDQLSELYGGRFMRRATEAIVFSAAWDAMKSGWINMRREGSPDSSLVIYDHPLVLYYGA
jgi:hypothetical protein